MKTGKTLDRFEIQVIHNVSLDDPLVLWQFSVMPFTLHLTDVGSPKYESIMALQFTDVGSLEYRFKGIILDSYIQRNIKSCEEITFQFLRKIQT